MFSRRVNNKSSGRHLKIAVPFLVPIMAVALCLTSMPARALQEAQSKPQLKVEGRETTAGISSKGKGGEEPVGSSKSFFPGNPANGPLGGPANLFNEFAEIRPDRPEQESNFIDCRNDSDFRPEPFVGDPIVYPILALQVSQYKLVAITIISQGSDVRDTLPNNGSMAVASFEDGLGRYFLVRTEDRIGNRRGRITKITASSVTIQEPGDSADSPRIIEIQAPAQNASNDPIRPGEEPRAQ